MNNVFGGNNYYQKIEVSSELERNFINAKTLDYLIKYFDMDINSETVNQLLKLKSVTNCIYYTAHENNLNPKYLDAYVPTFIMSYTSPCGNVHRESCVKFTPDVIGEAIKRVEKVIKKQDSAKGQRRLMNPALRKQILERDHYTCQCCGNNIYEEPNLLLEVDHIVPVSKGGKTEISNLQTLCWKCNRAKSNKI